MTFFPFALLCERASAHTTTTSCVVIENTDIVVFVLLVRVILRWDKVAALQKARRLQLQALKYSFFQEIVLVSRMGDEQATSHQNDIL
jgi:RNA polymerase-interacting CarD/CdnL/TRCF family regulator